jgi:deoxyribodipyrimidine photo-lyase
MAETRSLSPVLVWFRDDLRLADNPALAAAVIAARRGDRPIAFVYVLDDDSKGTRPLGGAARWWLHESLASLARDLNRRGHALILKKGPAAKIVPQLAKALGAERVFWNRRYGAGATVDAEVERALKRNRIATETFAANLLHEPGSIHTVGGRAYSVFAAFWRAALRTGAPRAPLPRPRKLPPPASATGAGGLPLDSLGLLPAGHDWTDGMRATWTPGEKGATAALADFAGSAAVYGDERDQLEPRATSRLSPHLRFGEVSPFQVWHAVGKVRGTGGTKFLSEIGWREFAWSQLAEHPDMARTSLRPQYDRIRWSEAFADDVWAWRRGRTGYPIVDAGMRQLWQTGWMHNRARMIAASFLVKHMLVDWRIGEEWFWDTLVDADAASNPFNWQWIAGSGTDAQPFFRIFNPVLQGEKFDPDGAYVRRYVPELARLPARYIHRPWTAPGEVLTEAGVFLGQDYPRPLIDHAEARTRALDAFAALKAAG